MGDSTLSITQRWWLFASWVVISSLVFIHPVMALVRLAISSEDASHVVLIPIISAAVLFHDRRAIFQKINWSPVFGAGVLLLAISIACASHFLFNSSQQDLREAGYILALAATWVSGFVLVFGTASARVGFFPLLFLLLMIPQPDFLLGHAIYLLRVGSAAITGILFDIFGVPALREGFVFHLATTNIEIAKECSGIRSSMVLLILGLLVAHFRLPQLWKKAVFILAGLFMMILKNGIRIATLTLLGSYVDRGFLTGNLHREGGIVFFILSLFLLWPVLLLLERGKGPDATIESTL